jgi:transposase
MGNELRTNAKRLSPEEQFQIRKSIIRLDKQGKTVKEIAGILDVSERHVESTKKRYREEGFAGISLKKRGRSLGEKRNLTPEQEKTIRDTIVDKNPDQLKLKGCMWTRKNIAELVHQLYGLSMPLSTLGYYLERWGFSVQRPTKKAYKQNPEQIDRWLNETYPSIAERAKAEDAEIYWGDETGVQNTADYLRGYAPIAETPVIQIEAQKFKANLLSAISNRGKLRFVIYDKMSPDTLIDFMWRLVRDTKRKVFLIVDNLRTHHAKKVKQWLEKHKDKIEVFYLPPYAPEYNPDEFLNSDLKRGVGNRIMPRSKGDIVKNVRSHLKALQLNPTKVTAFFSAPSVRYAAG